MSGRRSRLRTTLVLGAVLATAVPAVAPLLASSASANATHLTCGVKQTGRWERIPIRSFQPVSGIAASNTDTVTTYAFERQKPKEVAVTNGYVVQVSHTHGCAWSQGVALSPTVTQQQPFLGGNARIVTLGVVGSTVLAAVQEGSGAASRPHVLRSTQNGAPGSWTTVDNGLPTQGSPRLLRTASDGRTAYLTVSPNGTGGSDDGGTTGIIPLPGGGGGGGTPTGFLYRTTDGGASWTLQTGAGDLPGGGTGFTALDIDSGNADVLYGIAGGRLLVSRDAGGSFTAGPGSGYTAVTAASSQQVVAFSSGGAQISYNAGNSFTNLPAPGGVVSAAARAGDSFVLIQTASGVLLYDPTAATTAAVPPPSTPKNGTLFGDRSSESSFHGLAGHSLLRYVDPLPPGGVYTPPPVGDNTVPPPKPGTVSPAVQNVKLPVGDSQMVDFTLDLPKNPTPLDLFFLIDVSTGMSDVIEDVKAKSKKIVAQLQARNVDVNVGVGSIGTGPLKGEPQYPDAYAFPPTNCGGQVCIKPYSKPKLYQLLRGIGAPDAKFQQAIDELKLETPPNTGQTSNAEGQLIALKNLATGFGTKTEDEERLNLPTFSAVAPNQEAGWRAQPDVRKVVVLATNEALQAPYGGGVVSGLRMGSDEQPGSSKYDPRVDVRPTINVLRSRGIGVVGLTGGVADALRDLQRLATGTGMVAPAGGVACDGLQQLNAGDPLVCNNGEGFSEVITRVLESLVDRKDVKLVPTKRTPVLGALSAGALNDLDVKKANRVPFQVRVNCIDVRPGLYQQDVDLLLRGSKVGHARVNVTCVKAAAVVRPRPVALTPPVPPANPAPQPPPPPPPPPPAVQPNPQPQVQTQVQVNPMTAGAIQEQQELQLALALNGTFKEDDPAFNAGAQLAMVDRRKRESVQALGVLAIAMSACAGMGLARLRSKPDLRLRRATIR